MAWECHIAQKIEKIKVLAVDDDDFALQGLKILLGSSMQVDVVGTTSELEKAKKLIEEKEFDIFLADLKLPRNKLKATRADWYPMTAEMVAKIEVGLELISYCAERKPEAKILVLTFSEKRIHRCRAVQAGAHDYLVKHYLDGNIVNALHIVHHGGRLPQPPELKDRWGDVDTTPFGLVQKELELLEMMAEGMSDPEIASMWGRSDKTVRNIRASIERKMNVKGQRQLLAEAFREQLID